TSLSNKFTVAKGLHHFLISTIGNQNKGIPFEITVTAKDEDNSTVSSFNGTVNLTCSLGVGTFEPITLGPFVNGTFTGNIKINKAGDNITITVTDPVSGKTGTSNAFKVFGDKLIFKSTPQTIDLEQKSSPIVIGLLDPQGNPLIAPTNITVNLTSNSSTGRFSEDGVNWGITSITFTSGSSEKSFYYKDSSPGAWDITVSATNYESAIQRIVVSGKIADGSGQVSMTPASGLTNEKLNITFTFTATFSLSGGAIRLTMPSGFANPQLTDPNGECFASVTPGTGVSLGTVQTQLNNLIINIQTMASGNTLTIKLNNVTLPSIEGNYTFSFFTMGQGGTLTPIVNQPQFRVDRGFSLEILSLSVSPQTASVNAGYTIIIRVGTKGELSVSDEINIKFPTGTFIPATINTNLIKINDNQITTSPIINQSANTITVKTPIPVPKETTAKIEISPQAGIINPPLAGNYKIEVTTNKETKPASYNYVLSPAPPISDIEVNVKPQSAGKEAEYNILFRINTNLLEGDKIYIKFPTGTNLPQSILPTSIQVSGVPLRYEPLVIGRLLVLTLSAPIIKGENSIAISRSAKIKNPEIPDKYILYLYTSRDLNEVPSKPYEIVGTPYTIITVTPESPDGINGWYITKPKIKFEGKGEGVIETYYYWDDEEPQLYIGEFIAKEGEHILYFYSKTKGLDNAEPVRSRTFKVDSTPPKITIIEPTIDYTYKSDLVISGITEPTILVSAQTSRTTSNTRGQFNLIVKLVPGLNTIKVQAIDSAGNIGEVTLNITLDTTPPYLSLDPSITKWMEVFTETFEVKGKVEVGATLTINGMQVTYDSQGNFSYTVILQEGNNSISIVAVDKAGNENSIYLPVKYIKRTILKIKIGSRTVYVNDKPLQIEAAPWIDKKSGRAMVPLRVIVEAFGATVEYRYISFGDERVSIIFKLKRIDLRIGSNIAYIEGLPVRLDAPPVIINGRTFVPIRFIMETFGAKVDWDPFSSEITITYPAP
ncbi:MAG: stalk domain-containing protein, partial [Thermoplasmata archaeon]